MRNLLAMILSLLVLSGCAAVPASTSQQEQRVQIVATIFPAYDFARAVAGDLADVTLLLPPGAESHSYEPTPADMIQVQNCDLFFYLGGESDTWVETILSSVETQGDALRMIDCVELLEEIHAEGMQEEPGHHHHDEEESHHDHPEDAHSDALPGLGEVAEMDEHVWTAPKNAAIIIRTVAQRLAELDPEHADEYRANAEAYASEIDALDLEFHAFFDSLPSRTMVFGDRFPLRYFAHEFALDYFAAFPGCSTQTEPSAATIAFLTDKIRAQNIPTVFYIEFSNHLVADCIAEATGAKTALFHTCHNVSRDELAGGATYLSLMSRNLEILRSCL